MTWCTSCRWRWRTSTPAPPSKGLGAQAGSLRGAGAGRVQCARAVLLLARPSRQLAPQSPLLTPRRHALHPTGSCHSRARSSAPTATAPARVRASVMSATRATAAASRCTSGRSAPAWCSKSRPVAANATARGRLSPPVSGVAAGLGRAAEVPAGVGASCRGAAWSGRGNKNQRLGPRQPLTCTCFGRCLQRARVFGRQTHCWLCSPPSPCLPLLRPCRRPLRHMQRQRARVREKDI
jgi:hypothetical protein